MSGGGCKGKPKNVERRVTTSAHKSCGHSASSEVGTRTPEPALTTVYGLCTWSPGQSLVSLEYTPSPTPSEISENDLLKSLIPVAKTPVGSGLNEQSENEPDPGVLRVFNR